MYRRWSPTSLSRAIDSLADVQIILIINAPRWWSTNMARTSSTCSVGLQPRAGVPKNTTRNGYHLAFWKTGNLEYCAVSDTGWDELKGLVRLLQDLGAARQSRTSNGNKSLRHGSLLS